MDFLQLPIDLFFEEKEGLFYGLVHQLLGGANLLPHDISHRLDVDDQCPLD